MTRILFLLCSFFYACFGYGAELLLDSSRSSIDYEALKFGNIRVIGELREEGRSSLKGQLSLTDLKTASDLTGFVNLQIPFFNSDSYRRDDAVRALFEDGVLLEIKKITSYDSDATLMKFLALITINGHSEQQKLSTRLSRSNGTVLVEVKITLDRSHYGLIFTGITGILDQAIQNEVKVSYRLQFRPDVSEKHAILNAVGQTTEGVSNNP